MDRNTAAIIKRRVQQRAGAAEAAPHAPATERMAQPSLRSVSGIRGELRHGIVHELDSGAVRVSSDNHGLRTATGTLIVPVGLAYWAMRHAQVDRPACCPIVLMRERDLAAGRLLAGTATFSTQVPNSKYLKVGVRWNRSRSNRWVFEYETIEATSEHHIGFVPLDEAVERALTTVGAQVNIGLRRMTLIP